MDEKKVREAIKEFEIEKQTYEDMISYCKHFEPKNDCGRYEEKIAICKTAIEALEKQLSKKVDIMDYPLDDINFRCPVCKSEYICEKEHEHFYCPTCGQKLDWKEAEEEVV